MMMRIQNLTSNPAPAARGGANHPARVIDNNRQHATLPMAFKKDESGRGRTIGVPVFNSNVTKNDWHDISLNLPKDVETALLERQYKRVPESANEKALQVIGKELR